MRHPHVSSFAAGVLAASVLVAVPVAAVVRADSDPHPHNYDGTSPSLTLSPARFLIGTSIDAAPPPGSPICDFPDPWNWKIPMRMRWTGSDAMSGVAGYDLWERSGQADEVHLLFGTEETSYDLYGGNYASECGGSSHTSSFWVKATDNRGNSASTTDAANEIVHVWQEDGSTVEQLVDPLQVIRTEGWWTSSCSCANGGATYTSTTAGAALTYTVTTTRPRQIAGVVAGTSPRHGRLEIWVDGKRTYSINTHAQTKKNRVIVWQQPLSVGTHTLTLTNLGSPGHSRIDVDSILLTFGQFHHPF